MKNKDISLLIVDDEFSVRDSLYQWFRTDGFDVETAEDTKEAFEKFRVKKWDIVLLDIKMPGMDGIEFNKHILGVNPDIIVIIITAFATVETAVQAIKDGALWDYIGLLESYRCKSDTSGLLRSYCISRAMNGATCTCKEDQVNPFRMLSEIPQIAEKMVFVDAASRQKWIEGSFAPFQESQSNELSWYVRPSRTITARHTKGFNASFADVHCQWIRYKDNRSVELANWNISPEIASPDNKDLMLIVDAVKSRKWGQ